MDWIHEGLSYFSNLDEGVRNATYGALGVIFGGLLSRFRRRKPERSVVSVNAPPGEYVKIEVGKERIVA